MSTPTSQTLVLSLSRYLIADLLHPFGGHARMPSRQVSLWQQLWMFGIYCNSTQSLKLFRGGLCRTPPPYKTFCVPCACACHLPYRSVRRAVGCPPSSRAFGTAASSTPPSNSSKARRREAPCKRCSAPGRCISDSDSDA